MFRFASASCRGGKIAAASCPRLLQGFVSSDVQVVSSPDPAAHPPHEAWEERRSPGRTRCIAAISRYAWASTTYRPAFARSVAGCSGFSTNETIRPTASSSAIPQARGLGAWKSTMVNGSSCAAMEGQQRTQVDIAEVIGVDDHDLIGLVRQVGVGRDGASRAQKRRLVRLDQAKPAFGIDLSM